MLLTERPGVHEDAPVSGSPRELADTWSWYLAMLVSLFATFVFTIVAATPVNVIVDAKMKADSNSRNELGTDRLLG